MSCVARMGVTLTQGVRMFGCWNHELILTGDATRTWSSAGPTLIVMAGTTVVQTLTRRRGRPGRIPSPGCPLLPRRPSLTSL